MAREEYLKIFFLSDQLRKKVQNQDSLIYLFLIHKEIDEA